MDTRRLQFRSYGRFKGEVYIRQLFQSWHRTLRRYERAWGPRDLAYVYNEQAQVGLLAVAAEKAKGLPFIEFSTKRRRGNRDYSGRADLKIFRIKTKEAVWVEAEPASVDCRNTIECLKEKMRLPFAEAKKSVETLAEADGLRLALVIVKLIGASPTSCDAELVRDRVYGAAKRLNAHFCAIHFCNRDLWTGSPHRDCPGIAAVGRIFPKPQ